MAAGYGRDRKIDSGTGGLVAARAEKDVDWHTDLPMNLSRVLSQKDLNLTISVEIPLV